uniref:DNA-directed RNA polymerase n=1 Tax=Nitzschia sp. PL1-4 TaxID=2083272 RepID=A0A2Z5ZB21_9STRA|nr:RNA polymerase beta'' subunit [Nitzschia sp. PL1-4]
MKYYKYNNNFIGKKDLSNLIKWSVSKYNLLSTSLLIEKLKYLGFYYATQGSISISIEDLKTPANKSFLLKKIEYEIFKIEKIHQKGKITEVERLQRILNLWEVTNEFLKNQVIQYFKTYDPLNSVYIMAFSGARGNISQVRQLVGMRGLMADQQGQVIDMPIIKNFQEGLTITDYLISSYGARKGLIDTALKTADSGYLTRKLIDVSQDIIIREKDCYTIYDLVFSYLNKKDILGRILSRNIYDPIEQKILFRKNTQITSKIFETIKKLKINKLYIRSPLTCNLYRSVCQKCYGWDLTNQNLIDIGSAIGILAGQSIGEPGTQLTMRTFHTGGVVDMIATEHDCSPLTGVFQFSNDFKGLPYRTNLGNIVRITKRISSAIIIPLDPKHEIFKLRLLPNSIIFLKNNQFIKEGSPLGDLSPTIQHPNMIKEPIRALFSGEIDIINHRKKIKSLTKGNLIWILSSKIFFTPFKTFINLYNDYRINKNSSIFRSKINSISNGLLFYKKNKISLDQKEIFRERKEFYLERTKLQRLTVHSKRGNSFLKYKLFNCFLNLSKKNSLKVSIQKNVFGILLLKNFFTITGGISYYDDSNKNMITTFIYSKLIREKLLCEPIKILRTLIWVNEELYLIYYKKEKILIRSGDYIPKGSLITKNLVSTTSGLVQIDRDKKIATVRIKSGIILRKPKKSFKELSNKKLFFPGELDMNNREILFFEDISTKRLNQILIRSIKLYEIPYLQIESEFQESKTKESIRFWTKLDYLYPSNQYITHKRALLSIASSNMEIKNNNFLNNKEIFFIPLENSKSLKLIFQTMINLKNFIPPKLYNRSINICSLAQNNQYINIYMILTYLENITPNSIEVIRIKNKNINGIKHLSLISNEDCFKLDKSDINRKGFFNINYIKSLKESNKIGKILFKNKTHYIVQKGMPYFFPESKVDTINPNRFNKIKRRVVIPSVKESIKFYKNFIIQNYNVKNSLNNFYTRNDPFFSLNIPYLFLKLDNNIYSSAVCDFFYKFKQSDLDYSIDSLKIVKNLKNTKDSYLKKLLLKVSIVKKQNKVKNKYFKSFKIMPLIFGRKFFGEFFKKTGFNLISQIFSKEATNLIFFNQGDYILSGEIIGFLNLEKRIANDITQGLPQIDAALEGQVKQTKRLNRTESNLAQHTFLTNEFIFHKMGLPLEENNTINPHEFLKIYFTYYGLKRKKVYLKNKLSIRKEILDNYDATYRSFKKVELLILNFVNNTYKSEGVFINIKHFEVIIKQMTTKVLITDSGSTSYYPQEIIDFYHLRKILSILKIKKKEYPGYIPLLYGITKSSLNNPSFLSAASFQETTTILKKAALEGKLDWLRGLKENIIVGNLLPIGSGRFRFGIRKV